MERKEIENEKIKRLRQWIKCKPAPPVRIDIEPTSTCNLNCKFCWTRSKERVAKCSYSNLLPDKRFLEIVEEAGMLGVLEWQIAGGWEPMMKPKLVLAMMEYIKKHNMFGCLTTNGVLFTENSIKKLVEIEWDEILFSLEGPSAEIHDSVTEVKGSFNRATKAMEQLTHWKKTLGAEKPEFSFHAVLSNKNYDKLDQMIVLGHELGCVGVNFEPLNIWSEEGRKLMLSNTQKMELKNFVEAALDAAKSLGIHTNAENLLEPRLLEKKDMNKILEQEVKANKENYIINSPCFDPWLNLEIRVSGHVVPCRLCDDDEGCEFIHSKSLEEIWFGEYFNSFRQSMMQKNMPGYCSSCAAGNVVAIRKIRDRLKQNNFQLTKIKNIVGL